MFEVNGTTFHDDTPMAVIDALENHRRARYPIRIRLYYGDQSTGLAWGDTETGYIGRPMGAGEKPQRVPLVLPTRASSGGGAILTHCVVKIECANKRHGGVIWKHPAYHEDAEHPIYITR